MVVKMHLVYEGNLRCRLTHGPSGSEILTDAPVDNMGKGEAFSPTDLLAAALGSCMLTVMGIAAGRNNVDLTGTTVQVEKEMVATPVRRIGKITVVFKMATGIEPAKRAAGKQDRNALCACGSGKKYKHCHMQADQSSQRL